jgi:hypothetical protein
MWKHWSIPHTHLTWLHLIFTSYQDCISIGGTALLWFYWSHSECDGRAENAFTKWVPGMFPITLKSLAEVYSCTRGLIWRKCSLNDCTILYFSEIKWFREHCVATAYTYETVPHLKLDWRCSRTWYWQECLGLRGRKFQGVREMYVMNRILTCYSLNIIITIKSRSIGWVRNVERVADKKYAHKIFVEHLQISVFV